MGVKMENNGLWNDILESRYESWHNLNNSNTTRNDFWKWKDVCKHGRTTN